MIDDYLHKGLRKKLVEELKSKGIFDQNVLKAIENVPRHLFIDNVFLSRAYEDKPFPIGEGQTISQPFTVAIMTQLLQINKGEKILEVGTGSGYQACVLAETGAKVFSIERQKNLFTKTSRLINELGYNIKLFYGDGYKGLPGYAPFDKIMVTAGAPFIPDQLVEQLKPGGKMVIPVGEKGIQKMILIKKSLAGEIEKAEHGYFQFVPLLEDKTG